MAKREFKKTKTQHKAIELLKSAAIYIMLYGGSRSGKTAIIIYTLLFRALYYRGSRHLILRRYFINAKQSIWMDTLPKVAKLIGAKGTYTEDRQDWYLKFRNGSEIWIGGLDDKERAERILGKEYATIFFDEANQFTWPAVKVALTRLAQKVEGLKNKAYFAMNPPAKSHWSYKVFILKRDPKTGKPMRKPDLYAAMQMNPKDNEENIGEDYIENVLMEYSDRERRRFLDGEFTADVEGALWNYDLIEEANDTNECPELEKVVVAIDPAVTNNPDSDEAGIVVTGKAGEKGYVLEDASGKHSPLGWAKKAVDMYYKHEANYILAEVNQGGDLVYEMIKQIDKNVPVKKVRAKKGKYLRAESTVLLYEQKRVKHIGSGLDKLETEMVDWDSTDPNAPSPNRIDALVYTLIFLFLKKNVTFVNKSAFTV